MCYNVSTLTKEKKVYAKLFARTKDTEQEMVEQLEASSLSPLYFTSGFSHQFLPVITNNSPDSIQACSWGLIPFWAKEPTKAEKLANSCLNARSESMFELPSFRNSAAQKRCLIIVDSGFEYRHFKGKAYPYLFRLKGAEPFAFAGLWDSCTIDGVEHFTCSIVTTSANNLMAEVHNNPKVKEPRMPVILTNDISRQWLEPINARTEKELIMDLCQPITSGLMEAYPVEQLVGKNGVGNKPEAMEKYIYPELPELD